MRTIRTLALGNLLAFLVHVILSYATQFKLVNARTVGDVSNQYSSLFTPAPFTFAIWGVIYVALALFCIYHLIMAYQQGLFHTANAETRNMDSWFIVNNLATAAWLVAWTNNAIFLSLVLIVVQLVSLIIIHQRLYIHDTQRPLISKVATQFPISIYFGWITIATIANASTYLVKVQWGGWGLATGTWAIIMIVVAVIIALLVIHTRRNVFYGLVLLWALYGIIMERQKDSTGDYEKIINVAWAGVGVVATACIIRWVRNIREHTSTRRFPAMPHAHASNSH